MDPAQQVSSHLLTLLPAAAGAAAAAGATEDGTADGLAGVAGVG